MNDEYEPESVDPPPPWEPADKHRDDLQRRELRRNTKPLGPASRRLAAQKLERQLNTRRRLLLVVALSVALLVVALLAFWRITRQGPFVATPVPLTPPISLLDLATEYPELADVLSDPKLDSAYKDFLVVYQDGGGDAALELARQRGMLNANGDLRLTLELDTENSAGLQRELEENGIQVTAFSGNLMDVAVPLGLLERLMAAGTADNLLSTITNLEHVVRIRLPQMDVQDQGGTEAPAASPPALGTPLPATLPAATPAPGGVSGLLTSSRLTLGLGVLLCVVAPLLLGLGVYLLISGLGLARRKNAAHGSLPLPGGGPWVSQPAAQPAAARTTGAQPLHLPPQEALPPVSAGVSNSLPTLPPALLPAAQVVTQRGPPPAPSVVPTQPETIACRRCGHPNRLAAKFCAGCGAALAAFTTPPTQVSAPLTQPEAAPPQASPQASPQVTLDTAPPEHPTYCWNCGQRLRPTSRFCPYCGDKI